MPLDPYCGWDQDQLNAVYQDRTGDIWTVAGFISDPAAILVNARTGERHVEVIGCPNADRFTRLVSREKAGLDGKPR